MWASSLAPDTVCPSCGQFVAIAAIDEVTGFCRDCSVTGNEQQKVELEAFLASNADHIEHYITKGYALNGAVARVAADVRPVCIVCRDSIKRAKRESVFCRKKPECRRMSRRYIYLYEQKGMTKIEALGQIIRELSE